MNLRDERSIEQMRTNNEVEMERVKLCKNKKVKKQVKRGLKYALKVNMASRTKIWKRLNGNSRREGNDEMWSENR